MRPGEVPPPAGELHRPGLYLHIPFCRNLCPFCPYNRIAYDDELFARFERAAHEEIDLIAPHVDGCEVVSLYVGGGTPTVRTDGLARLLDHLRSRLTIIGDTCIELHPANMDDACLDHLREAGVTQVSIGVQSASDRLLQRIGRNHDAATGLDAARRAARSGFDSVNADLMFALPSQTLEDWDCDVREVLDCGVDQLSTYPLFSFPYSDLGKAEGLHRVPLPPARRVRSMLDCADRLARERGMERCAVWSWAKPGKKKFSSVTRHHYIGIGPSAGSMTGSHFHVNTFDVEAYADALPDRRPVALSLPVDRRLEMVYWLYWRLYELRAADRDFRALFGESASLAGTFGAMLQPFCWAGWLKRDDGEYRVTHTGAFRIHRLQNDYSLDYIDRLWGRCRNEAWPRAVDL
ncbi:MAG: coproporphyrinogen III oxidase family protein [Phycisphaerales bacterium]|nr:MAG: coproporphyrinogen III oxidase family protein [Phycisphaerales bacterium]